MKRIRALFLIIFTFAFSACETVVDVDIPNQPSRLVPNAFLQADSAVLVELTRSQSILTNAELEPVSGAVVSLLEEGQPVATLEESQTPGIYFSTFSPSAGKTYTLTASKNGFEPVEASAFIALPVAIGSVEADTSLFLDTYYDFDRDTLVTEQRVRVDEIRLRFDDRPNERNYYEVSVYRFETQVQSRFDDQGNYLGDDTVRFFSPQYLRSDDPAFAGGESDPFGEGGEVYGTTLPFNDDFFNGKSYSLRFRPEQYGFYGNAEPELYVVLRTIDEGQYRYTRSVDLQYENDGNPFAEPVQVYSNVENGFGIVAGSSASRVVVDLE